MSLPKEGSRHIDEGIIVAVPMDWCKSPTSSVPYKIWAKQIQTANLAHSVRQTSDGSHVTGSLVRASYGDEAGTGGGVISGTHNAECTPKTWSVSVRAEDRNMVRRFPGDSHDDVLSMTSAPSRSGSILAASESAIHSKFQHNYDGVVAQMSAYADCLKKNGFVR